VVSDGQDTIRKAVTSLLPDKPYQLCHYHYLDNVGKELEDKDRKLKTKLKKGLRGIRAIEKQVEEMESGVEKEVLKDFTVAVRTTVQENSVYPFECGGIKVYDQMKDIESALSSCQQEQEHPLLEPLKDMVSGYKEYESEYKEVTMLSTLVKDIGRLIDPDNYLEDTEAKRKQRLNGYMGYVASLKGEHIQLSGSLEKIIKVTRSFMPGLFAYYQCPVLPVTNNDLEIFHRKVKTTHRRRTGRKSSHDYMLRYGKFAVYQIGTDCIDQIKSLAYSKLKVLKEQLQSVRSRYSKIYQIRHHRPKFLKGLVDRWKANTAPSNVPT
jgi:hypothetical protein